MFYTPISLDFSIVFRTFAGEKEYNYDIHERYISNQQPVGIVAEGR
jgi:hypothetical protein